MRFLSDNRNHSPESKTEDQAAIEITSNVPIIAKNPIMSPAIIKPRPMNSLGREANFPKLIKPRITAVTPNGIPATNNPRIPKIIDSNPRTSSLLEIVSVPPLSYGTLARGTIARYNILSSVFINHTVYIGFIDHHYWSVRIIAFPVAYFGLGNLKNFHSQPSAVGQNNRFTGFLRNILLGFYGRLLQRINQLFPLFQSSRNQIL